MTDFRLLIIDDNDAIHDDLKKILLPKKIDSALEDDEAILFGTVASCEIAFAIDSAYQGQEGLLCLQNAKDAGQPYALAFIDIRMPPGWDGIETISHLWNTDPNLQVVICTAYSDYSWIDIERKLGISDNFVILKKPFDPIEVTQLTHALTAKWVATRQARSRVEELDRMVKTRTMELNAAVSALVEATKLAEIAALEDPLTGLPNRLLFQNRLTKAIQLAAQTSDYLCALLYLDLDRFKIINDSLGHLAGDEVLIEVAQRLESCIQFSEGAQDALPRKDLVARLGGDEFAILLDSIHDISDALRVANRIVQIFAVPFSVCGKEVVLSASIGIATSASRYKASEDMLRDADTAMYRAKARGQGRCFLFDESMHVQAVERLQLESEMRLALERNEFFLRYQPIISLKDEKLAGFEALIRWLSPSRGIVEPKDFIPMAEETGLILPIGTWVLREACRQISLWQQEYKSCSALNVSVNISALQLSQPNLLDLVTQALHETGISALNLRLELTESLAMEEPEKIIPLLKQLQKINVKVSIDDFGTGYSSLSHLHHFSVDTLKIDRSFVSNMEVSKKHLDIVQTIVNLAHNLGMKVIAEGVETSAQANSLKGMNCDFVQGYLYSRPLDPAAIDSMLASSSNKVPNSETSSGLLPEPVEI